MCTCDGVRGRGGRAEGLPGVRGGSSGGWGSSSWSRLPREADLTVTTLEEEVRESLLEAILCLEGDPGDALLLPPRTSSVEEEEALEGDLRLRWRVTSSAIVGDLSVTSSVEAEAEPGDLTGDLRPDLSETSPCEADLARFPVLTDMDL